MPDIAITMGDPSGIGIEVILKALNELKAWNKYIVIGAENLIEAEAEKLELPPPENIVDTGELMRDEVPYGRATKQGGKAAYKAIVRAIDMALKGEIKGIVTAPIHKRAFMLAGINYPGHTEILASYTKAPRCVMMYVSDEIKVSLVTTHIPICEVPKKLSKISVLETIVLTDDFLRHKLDMENPKIVVCALNPHGEFGIEEEEVIEPAVVDAQKKGINVEGPVGADAAFVKEYDAIVAMYHDQGTIPVKVKAFEKAVNVTIGLPFVRTSPIHGTAYDIAGKGEANPSSMIEAIKLAEKLVSKLKEEKK